MRRTSLKKLLGIAGIVTVVGVGALGAGSASADQYSSHAAAAAAGDPAATALEMITPAVYLYEGHQISEKEMAAKELVCLQTAANFQCYDSAAELEASRSTASTDTVSPDMECGGGISLLYTWANPHFEGIGATLEARGVWADFRTEMENNTTSFAMGQYSGHLSENTGGGGYWYPGDTGECATASDLGSNGLGWNNRISSRYRN